MKEKGLILGLMIIFVFLIFINPIHAQPPFQVNVNVEEGFNIVFPKFDVLTLDEDFDFRFHVFNISNGVAMDNDTVSCYFHLYNKTGDSLYRKSDININPDHTNTWTLLIKGGNFSYVGDYAYLVHCNSSSLGGFASAPFVVTKTGEDLTTHESLIYFLLTLAIFGIFLLSLYFTIITPYSNNTNEKGMVIKVTKTKYIKLGLILLSYVLFIWLLNVLIGVSDNFLTLTLYYGFVSFMFTILMHLSIPFGIFILIVAFFEIIKDADIQGNINKFGSAFK